MPVAAPKPSFEAYAGYLPESASPDAVRADAGGEAAWPGPGQARPPALETRAEITVLVALLTTVMDTGKVPCTKAAVAASTS